LIDEGEKTRKEASSVISFLTFHYRDDILSQNNSRFDNYVDRIYLIELEIKDTVDTARLVLHIEFDSDGF
jgi:hypothetical protein